MTITAPPRLDLLAVDMSNQLDANTGDPWIVLRLIDRTGLRLDCPIPARHAAAFGEALATFAAEVAYQ